VGDQLFYVSNRAELICASAADGKAKWTLDMRKELGVSPYQGSGVVAARGRRSRLRRHRPGGRLQEAQGHESEGAELHRVDKATGKVKWQDNSPGEKIFQGQWGSPSYGVIDGRAQVIFPGGDGWVYSLRSAHRQAPLEVQLQGPREARPTGARDAQPARVAPSSSAIASSSRRGSTPTPTDPAASARSTRGKSGDVTATAELWKVAGDQFGCSISNVAVQDGWCTRCSTRAGRLLRARDGKAVWQHDLLAVSWGSPLLADGKLYIRTGEAK
jgi:outer membrane protein assembly factor BamB